MEEQNQESEQKSQIESDYNPVPQKELVGNKKNWGLIIGITVLFLVLVSGVIYWWSNLEIDNPVVNQETNKKDVVKEVVIEDKEGWITYKNTELNFGIQYPDDWKIYDNPQEEYPRRSSSIFSIIRISMNSVVEFGTQEELEFDEKKEKKIEVQEILARALAGEDFATLATEYSEDPGSAMNGGDLGYVIKGLFIPEFDKAIFEDLKVGEISSELIESAFGYHIIKKIDERLNEEGEIEVRSAHILFKDILPKDKPFDSRNIVFPDTLWIDIIKASNIKELQDKFNADYEHCSSIHNDDICYRESLDDYIIIDGIKSLRKNYSGYNEITEIYIPRGEYYLIIGGSNADLIDANRFSVVFEEMLSSIQLGDVKKIEEKWTVIREVSAWGIPVRMGFIKAELQMNQFNKLRYVFPKILDANIGMGNEKAIPPVLKDYEYIIFPEILNGSLSLNDLLVAQDVTLPKVITGALELDNLKSTKGLVLPEQINTLIIGLTSADGLVLPETIEGGLVLSNLTSADGLVLPKTVGWFLYLDGLTSSYNLILPKTVGQTISLNGLISTEGLVLPEITNEYNTGGSSGIYLESLISAKGLIFPETLDGGILLTNLESAEGLILPQKMTGNLLLNNLSSIDNLVLPEIMEGTVVLNSISEKEIQELRSKYPNITFDKWED